MMISIASGLGASSQHGPSGPPKPDFPIWVLRPPWEYLSHPSYWRPWSKPWIVNRPVKVRILGSELSKNSVINGWTSILINFPMMGWILSVCQFLNALSSCQFPNPATKQPRVGKSPLMVQKKKKQPQTPLVTAKSLLMIKPCYSN